MGSLLNGRQEEQQAERTGMCLPVRERLMGGKQLGQRREGFAVGSETVLVIRPKDLARKWCWTGTGREGMKWAGA